jgi:hypothetical protein
VTAVCFMLCQMAALPRPWPEPISTIAKPETCPAAGHINEWLSTRMAHAGCLPEQFRAGLEPTSTAESR